MIHCQQQSLEKSMSKNQQELVPHQGLNVRDVIYVYIRNKKYQDNLVTSIRINEMEPFLKQIITGDEKLVKYENITRKRSWSKADDSPQTIPKPGLTKNKVLLSVWWDWKGIVHYDFNLTFI